MVVIWWGNRGRVTLEKGDVAKQLVFPGESCTAGTQPFIFATMLFMRLEIRNDREFLYVTSAASVAFLTMGSLVMVFDTQDGLQRLKLFVGPVALAPHIRA